MAKEKQSIKVDDSGIEFLKKLRTNRRKLDIDESDLSYWKLISIISNWFKLNPQSYSELVKMEEKK